MINHHPTDEPDFVAKIAEAAEMTTGALLGRPELMADPETDLLAMARKVAAEAANRTPEKLEERLRLREQYDDQLDQFIQARLIEPLAEGLYIQDKDGRHFAFPTFEQVEAAVGVKRGLLETKASQGFTKLLLVPTAMPLSDLKQVYQAALAAHDGRYGRRQLLDQQGRSVKLNQSTPIVWDEPIYGGPVTDPSEAIRYYPKNLDQSNHGGMTKAELVEQTMTSTPGWEILMIEDMPDQPMPGEGENIGDRWQLEAGLSPEVCLAITQSEAHYSGEFGFTPESYLAYSILHLEETDQILTPSQNHFSWLTGVYLPSGVPAVTTAITAEGASIVFSLAFHDSAFPDSGAKTVVRVI